jgi:hypothetical protein
MQTYVLRKVSAQIYQLLVGMYARTEFSLPHFCLRRTVRISKLQPSGSRWARHATAETRLDAQAISYRQQQTATAGRYKVIPCLKIDPFDFRRISLLDL